MNVGLADAMARHLISQHLDEEWRFRFDGAKTRLGSCNSTDKVITLSRRLVALNDEAIVLDTILHEIAHAKAGARAGHGPTWRRHARALGATPARCLGNGVQFPRENWRGRCPHCGELILRYRRAKLACARCCRRFNGGKWSPKFLFVWETPEAASQLPSA